MNAVEGGELRVTATVERIQRGVEPPKRASDVGALSLLIAERLDAFAGRVGEVPPSAVDDMTCAVAEISQVVYSVAGAGLEAARHSVRQNLSKAARVLRSGAVAKTNDNAQVLDAIVGAAGLLLEGVDLALAQELESQK